MEIILHDILSVLETNAPLLGLSYVDEDFGQLESLDSETDVYPLTFPAVLVSLQGVEWSETNQRNQTGVCSVVVRLLVDCYDDTHANCTQLNKALQRCAMNYDITNLLHGLRILDNSAMLTRVASQTFNAPHLIKVYETTYTARMWEKFDDMNTTKIQSITFVK